MTLYELYTNIYRDDSRWNYYHHEETPDFDSIWTADGNAAKEFVIKMLDKGCKLNTQVDVLVRLLDAERVMHVVSCYFLGLSMYYECSLVGSSIDVMIRQLFPMCDSVEKQFQYIWMVLCLFHDLGYAYEKGILPNAPNYNAKGYKKDKFLPQCLSARVIKQYHYYRRQCMKVIDHGIIGGQTFYEHVSRLRYNRHQILSLPSDCFEMRPRYCERCEGLCCRPDLDKVYRRIANTIMAHNVFFTSSNSDGAKCYNCFDLQNLVYQGTVVREIRLPQHPLLFLFDFVDTIEPTKCLWWNENRITILQSVELQIMEGSVEVCCNTSNEVYRSQYIRQIKGMNDWLTDVMNGDEPQKLIVTFG